jgi:1-acyl-sn-glycerol-3-phosphate acyltransferase
MRFMRHLGVRRRIGKAWLRAFGWSVAGGKPDVTKAVIVAAPHTSNWDLPFMLAVSYALEIDIAWIGKHTIFAPPFGSLMRLLGGIPVDRRSRNNAVAAAVDVFRERDELLLVVPPEGTRKRAARWKTGFYYIAVGAEVPIVLGFLDYEKKQGGLGHVFKPTGKIDADMDAIRAFYAGIKGKVPGQTTDVALRDDSSDEA